MRYLKIGTDGGTPVVMIHGFGADMASFMFNQDDLAQGRAVYVIDLPGHGASSKNVGDGSLDRLAADVLAFMQVVGIGTAHLVGHSLGGAIAVSIALLRPERVESLVLIAPSGFGPGLTQDFLDGFVAETRARKLKAVLEYLVADPETISSAMVDDVLKFKRLDGATDALRAISAHLAQGGRQQVDLRAKLPTLTMPITIIWGEQDRIAPIAHADGLPGSVHVVRVAGAGHIPHMEKAAEVNAAIKQGVGGSA
jgi:pyruvate dehydrogenase E2 component (dihydrolipoamide acetyltransferase)